MATAPNQPDDSRENAYLIDAQNAAEMARLMRQEHLITEGMGGLFPEQIDLSEVHRVIDLACGPGGWALDVAYDYPEMEVVGVDISERMIAYATAQAQVQQRENVSFRMMNILEPLDFPEQAFDLVNARFIQGFMRYENWPIFFQECKRVLRPGGILRLTEVQMGTSNKPSFEKAWSLINLLLRRARINFSPSGTYNIILEMLPYLFRQAGLPLAGKMAHSIDFSFGMPTHESFYHDNVSIFQLLEPALLQMQVITSEEWQDLSAKALAEMYEEDFCIAWQILTVWAHTPSTRSTDA